MLLRQAALKSRLLLLLTMLRAELEITSNAEQILSLAWHDKEHPKTHNI
jgi:hypothetical protein